MLKILINDKQIILNRKTCRNLLFYFNHNHFIRSITKVASSSTSNLLLKKQKALIFHSSQLFEQQQQRRTRRPRPEPPDFNDSKPSSSSDDSNKAAGDESGGDGDKEKNEKESEMRKQIFTLFFSSVFFLIMYAILEKAAPDQNAQIVSWNEFINLMLAKGEVKKLTVLSERELVVIELHPGAVIKGKKPNQLVFYMQIPTDKFEDKLRVAEDELHIRTEDRVPVIYKEDSIFNSPLGLFLLITAAWIVFYFATRKASGGAKMTKFPNDLLSQFTKARYTMVDPHLQANIPTVTFKDVAGLKEAKVEIMEFVQYLKEPERFQKLGAKVPKGALLLGPPGCGKTLLAKALAAEAGVPFFNMAGTEFIEVIGGVGAARVRDLFKEARKHAPSIVFIDEIDAIGKKRSTSEGVDNSEQDQTLNQLLSEMDGIETRGSVIVLASTNRPDVLDKALTRPGRLDRKIMIDLPTHQERIEILNVNLQRLKLSTEVDQKFVSHLSHLTARMSGADLANVCNEAALHAARDLKNEIQKIDFEVALEKVMSGAEKKNRTIVGDEQKLIAYYECGRVLMSWLLEYGDLLYKVSIVPRTKTIALAHFMPSDKKIISKEELFDRMCMRLGGRVAESIVFNSITTRSQEDLKPLTKLAYAQVQSFGMSDKVGQLSFPTRDEQAESGMVGGQPFSKKLKNLIDQEANQLIASAHKRTEKMLRENIESLHKLTEELMKKETLNFEDIIRILGPPKSEEKLKQSGLVDKTLQKQI